MSNKNFKLRETIKTPRGEFEKSEANKVVIVIIAIITLAVIGVIVWQTKILDKMSVEVKPDNDTQQVSVDKNTNSSTNVTDVSDTTDVTEKETTQEKESTPVEITEDIEETVPDTISAEKVVEITGISEDEFAEAGTSAVAFASYYNIDENSDFTEGQYRQMLESMKKRNSNDNAFTKLNNK